MIQVSIEECLDKIPNHFDLTLAAARRARQLQQPNTTALVDDVRHHKTTITALREVAAGQIGLEVLSRSK